MKKITKEQMAKDILLINGKKFKEKGFTMAWMDTYVSNYADEAATLEYAKLALDANYQKTFEVNGKTRTSRDVEKVKEWFINKFFEGYEYKKEETAGTRTKTAEEKLLEKLAGLKF